MLNLNTESYLSRKKDAPRSQATRHQELACRYAESLDDLKYVAQYLKLFKKLAAAWLLSETELDALLGKAKSVEKPGAYFLAGIRGMLKPRVIPK